MSKSLKKAIENITKEIEDDFICLACGRKFGEHSDNEAFECAKKLLETKPEEK